MTDEESETLGDLTDHLIGAIELDDFPAEKREELASAFARAAMDWFGEAFDVAEACDGRVVVRTIDAHGLQIGLDAMDEATEVRFPRGATARWEA